jgi:hypothetical protein
MAANVGEASVTDLAQRQTNLLLSALCYIYMLEKFAISFPILAANKHRITRKHVNISARSLPYARSKESVII